MPWLHRPTRHGLCHAGLLVPLLGAAAVSGAARAAPLAYEGARTLSRSVSDLQQSVEVSKRNYEVRSADSLGRPEVFVNATPIEVIKTGSVPVPPLGTVDFTDNFSVRI